MNISRLLPLAGWLRNKHPYLYSIARKIGKRYFGRALSIYPHMLGEEDNAVVAVLRSSDWNMAYGRGLAHEKLEAEFADYVGVAHAIAVNTGGMAIQMVLRAAGMKPGDEVVHQIDTCSANAFAIMNAGCTPIFADSSTKTFMLSEDSLHDVMSENTRVLMPVHMWGNPEDMEMIQRAANARNLFVLEDACLALGARVAGRPVGSFGHAGVFSFGCLKPIQAGEGGMIVTNDEILARELRSLRHWGDRTIEYGVRDSTNLAWNGRMSEIIAAVVREQLKGYPTHLRMLQDSVEEFRVRMERHEGIEVLGSSSGAIQSAYTQVVLKLKPTKLPLKKVELIEKLRGRAIQVWHGNFEAINSLSFFRAGNWKDWILKGNVDRAERNYKSHFRNAKLVYDEIGLGIGKMHFLSPDNLDYLIAQFDSILSGKR